MPVEKPPRLKSQQKGKWRPAVNHCWLDQLSTTVSRDTQSWLEEITHPLAQSSQGAFA